MNGRRFAIIVVCAVVAAVASVVVLKLLGVEGAGMYGGGVGGGVAGALCGSFVSKGKKTEA